MDVWPRRDKKAEERRHAELEGKIRDAQKRHRTWISQEFPNREDVLRDARDVIEAFEADNGLTPGGITVNFDDHGTRLGYHLTVRGRLAEEHDLVQRIRERTGETFEVDHIFD